MKKLITFGGKPSATARYTSADAWVSDRHFTKPMKRLTIDVPLNLHTRVKTQCAVQGLKMADVVRDMLERRAADASKGEGGGVRRAEDAPPIGAGEGGAATGTNAVLGDDLPLLAELSRRGIADRKARELLADLKPD